MNQYNVNYQKIWDVMNDLEMVTSKICSARQILDCAIDALQEHQNDKAETLMYATQEYLEYYLEEFDRKFKDAWSVTISAGKKLQVYVDNEESVIISCDNNNPSEECKSSWNSFWEENYYPEEYSGSTVSSVEDNMPPWGHSDMEALSQQKEDKVVKWRLPVEEVKDSDTDETEYFITFPDDLLEAANLNPGDEVYWEDKNDGSFILRKVTKPLGGDEC
jgi:hypothetical protein